MDPLLAGLIAALVGGAVGAAISAGTSLRLARGVIREEARAALWDYQRALRGFANRGYSDAGYGDGLAFMANDDFKAVVKAYAHAYRWSGYMPRPVRIKLFRDAQLNIGYSPYDDEIAANSANSLADELEFQLDRRFPLHWTDRFRPRQRGAVKE